MGLPPRLPEGCDATQLAPLEAGASRSLLGGALVAVSFVLWAPLPALPFLSLPMPHKAALAAGLVGGAEVAFWLGIVLAGPALVQRVRAGWRRFRTSRNFDASARFDSFGS